MDDHNFLQTNECYKSLNKHMNCSKCNTAINHLFIIFKKVEQFVNYVLTITFSHIIKIGFVLILLLNRMLVLKQTFRRNKISQKNNIVQENKIIKINSIDQINKLFLVNKIVHVN